MSVISVIVGDKGGVVLSELAEATVEQVTWRSNEVGQADIVLPLWDVSRYRSLLQFGNTILLQFDNGLPDWGGIIDTPRSWRPGQFQVTAYSAEYLLALRVSGKNDIYRNQPVGEIWRASLADANQQEWTGLSVATPWFGGDGKDAEYHYKPLLEIARELSSDLSGADFYVTAAETGGHIEFTARFVERRGRDLEGVALVDGRNITEPVMEEQGPIMNQWYVVGSGSSWYTRYVAQARDEVGVNLYRLREQSEIQSQIGNPTMLHAIAEQRLAGASQPGVSVTLAAIDAPPARFADYDVGDSLLVDVPWAGFTGLTGRVRVLGREYQPGSGVCNLVVEEVQL